MIYISIISNKSMLTGCYSSEFDTTDKKDSCSYVDKSWSSTNASEDLQKKFEELKKRRQACSSVHDKRNRPVTSKLNKNACDEETNVKVPRKQRKREKMISEIESFLPDVFNVVSEYDPHNLKKTKLEEEVDKCIQNKHYERAEQLSSAMVKRDCQTQVNKAFEAMKYQKQMTKKNEARKRKKKLKWSFDHKKKWETKGNM